MSMKPTTSWLGKPILDNAHVGQLELLAAANEFRDKLPRHQAEAKAYLDYVRDQRLEAAAHHLGGIKAASALGDMETARKHGTLYELHMKALGFNPMDAVPHEVMSKLNAPGRPSQARFKAHAGDTFAVTDARQNDGLAKALDERREISEAVELVKAESPACCDWEPCSTTGKRCGNPRSRKVGDKYGCHHHADLMARDARAAERYTTPKALGKKDPTSWQSADGLSIPRAGTGARSSWDKNFSQALTQHFGKGKPTVVALDSTVPRNPAKNGARVDLYQNMASKEQKLPPIVVQRYGEGQFYVLDGNHRVEAAKRAGLTHLPAIDVSSR
jgi:hypothetical protein